ncbi:MAG: isoprenyl transferase [Deltaproteobacteria bacterium]|nr:isoprenyl transferase [Deltaproteobacteria bacterium]
MHDLITQIDKTRLPHHIAIIMDGNGRWAKNNGLPRIEGHRRGAEVVENITELSREIGIKYLTLYAFSKENWKRPAEEVHMLMALLYDFLVNKKDKMIRNGIRLNAIGDIFQLPEEVLKILNNTIAATAQGKEMVLTLALSYGARDEIIRAVKKLADDVIKNNVATDLLSEDYFGGFLDTKDMPDPDLIIRTSGENRISNFLLWQSAYAELKFIKPFWPEFNSEMFLSCLVDYQNRERRFGKTSEQLD